VWHGVQEGKGREGKERTEEKYTPFCNEIDGSGSDSLCNNLPAIPSINTELTNLVILLLRTVDEMRLTVEEADAVDVILTQLEVGDIPGIVRIHDGCLDGGMTQTQSMAELMNGYL